MDTRNFLRACRHCAADFGLVSRDVSVFIQLRDTPNQRVRRLRQLPVSRVQGGTVHYVTPDQWAQLTALFGGWPEPYAGQDNEASD